MLSRLERLGQDLYDGLASAGESATSLIVTDVAVPVYLIHRGPEAEAYDIHCDFTAFFTGDATGLLRRPKLEVWAGRGDIDRAVFASRMRDAFLDQLAEAKLAFAAANARELAEMSDSVGSAKGGIATLLGAGGLMLMVSNPLVNLILLALALTAGRQSILGLVSLAGQIAHRTVAGDGEARLDAEAETLRHSVDTALRDVEITLHRDLYRHAHRGLPPSPLTGMDRAAWPLPDTIRAELG